MKRKSLCFFCLRRKPSTDTDSEPPPKPARPVLVLDAAALPTDGTDHASPEEEPTSLLLAPLPSFSSSANNNNNNNRHRTTSLAALSVITTDSGMSEAGREIRRIFDRCRREGMGEGGGGGVGSEVLLRPQPPPPSYLLDRAQGNDDGDDDVPTRLPRIVRKKSSSRLSSVFLRPRISRESSSAGLSRRSSKKRRSGGGKLLERNNGSAAETQRELKRALKERLERELRGDGEGGDAGYDPDATSLMDGGGFGSKVGSSTFRGRVVPYSSLDLNPTPPYSSLDLDPTPQEECEAIDFGLAQEYRSMLASVEIDSIYSGGSFECVDDVDDVGGDLDKGAPELNTILKSKSDSVLVVHEAPLYQITSSPKPSVGEEIQRSPKLDENSDLDQTGTTPDRELEYHTPPSRNRPAQVANERDAREHDSFWFSDMPHDSGISLRDLDPSEYSGSSSSSIVPSWLKRASVLLHTSRYASDPYPRSKRSWEPCSEGANFCTVDGYPGSILENPSRELSATAGSPLSSPSSAITRAINDIEIPSRMPRRSTSDAATLRSRRQQNLSSGGTTPERRTSLNSFRQRFFSLGDTPPQDDVFTDQQLFGRSLSTEHGLIRRRKSLIHPPESKGQKSNGESGDTQEHGARETAILIPRATKSPRKSRFKEEFEDENTPLPQGIPEVHRGLNHFTRYISRARPTKSCDGSELRAPQFKTPEFKSQSLPGDSDTAEQLWERALRMHKREKDSGYLEPTGFYRGRRSISPARLSVSSPRRGTSPSASPGASSAPSQPGSLRNNRSDKSLRPSFDRASSRSGSSSLFVPRARKTPSVKVIKRRPSKATGLLAKKPSGTWAKFPSHDRAQRIGPAGLSDSVVSRDFAQGVILPAQLLEQAQQDNTHFSWKDRIKRDLTNRFASNSYGHRSSISVGGGVEYPDLEILPSLETPFHKYTEEEDELASDHGSNVAPSGDEQTSRSNSPYLQVPGMCDFGFDHPRLRRISTPGIAPDVVIEDYDELSTAESREPTRTSSQLLGSLDVLRPRPETGTLGTSRSSNIGSSNNNLNPGKEIVDNLFQIPTIDITNHDAAPGAVPQAGGCLHAAGNQQPSATEPCGQISIAPAAYEDSVTVGPQDKQAHGYD